NGMSEPSLEEAVRRVELTSKIRGQQDRGDEEPAEHVTKRELQEGPVPLIGAARHADERERARLRRHDAGGDRPPGNATAGEEIAFERPLAAAQPGAEG